ACGERDQARPVPFELRGALLPASVGGVAGRVRGHGVILPGAPRARKAPSSCLLDARAAGDVTVGPRTQPAWAPAASGRGEPRPAYWELLPTTPPGGPDGPHPRGRGLPGRARPAGGDARGRRAPRALRARRSRGPPAPDGRRRDPGPGPGPGRRRRPGAGGAGPDAPARGRLRTAGGAAAPQPGACAGALGEGRGVHEGRSAA